MKIKRLSQFTLLITMRLGQFTVLFHSHSIDCKGCWWYNLKFIQSYCQGWRRLPLSYKGRLSKGGTNVVTTSSWSLHRDFCIQKACTLKSCSFLSLIYYLAIKCLRFLQTWNETLKEFPSGSQMTSSFHLLYMSVFLRIAKLVMIKIC